jgi:hypothetical protein
LFDQWFSQKTMPYQKYITKAFALALIFSVLTNAHPGEVEQILTSPQIQGIKRPTMQGMPWLVIVIVLLQPLKPGIKRSDQHHSTLRL